MKYSSGQSQLVEQARQRTKLERRDEDQRRSRSTRRKISDGLTSSASAIIQSVLIDGLLCPRSISDTYVRCREAAKLNAYGVWRHRCGGVLTQPYSNGFLPCK